MSKKHDRLGSSVTRTYPCPSEALCCGFSFDGKRVASGGKDSKVLVFSLHAPLHPQPLKGHEALVNLLCWAPDTNNLCTASSVDRSLRLWEYLALLTKAFVQHKTQ
jgi:WD40 repeat protein